jgi:hypothetical protein
VSLVSCFTDLLCLIYHSSFHIEETKEKELAAAKTAKEKATAGMSS